MTTESKLVKEQVKTLRKKISAHESIAATVRYDDQCGNGHNTFSITGTIRDTKNGSRRDNYEVMGGCIHDEIAQHFPELAPFIKWHLTSSDGPMHYVANTVYHASNRDCWGKLKGEPYRFEVSARFSNAPFTHRKAPAFMAWLKSEYESGRRIFDVIGIAHDRAPGTYGTHYTFGGFTANAWHECPFRDEQEAQQWAQALAECPVYFDSMPTAWGEGKARDFDAARNCAVWPEATEEELSLPKEELVALLNARLPQLLADFRRAVELLGFVW